MKKVQLFKKELFNLWHGCFRYISGATGIFLRRIIYRKAFKKVGRHVTIQEAVVIKWAKNLSIGNNVSINEFCWIEASGGIEIGDNVWIAPKASLISFSHKHALKYHMNTSGTSRYGKGKEYGKIVIEDNVWIGAHSIILKGVHIGEGSIIGAGSVVLEDVPKFTVVAGVPAKYLKDVDKEMFFADGENDASC